MTVRANVADEEELKALFEAAVNEFGKIDILVNNAWPGFRAGTVTSKMDKDRDRFPVIYRRRSFVFYTTA